MCSMAQKEVFSRRCVSCQLCVFFAEGSDAGSLCKKPQPSPCFQMNRQSHHSTVTCLCYW